MAAESVKVFTAHRSTPQAGAVGGVGALLQPSAATVAMRLGVSRELRAFVLFSAPHSITHDAALGRGVLLRPSRRPLDYRQEWWYSLVGKRGERNTAMS